MRRVKQAAGTRTERDSLGEKAVPADAYYGIQTARALENFRASGLRHPPSLLRAYASIKKAAARANLDLGVIDRRRANAIVWACDAILGGAHADQFGLDVYQAGAGTSFNMNVNEVIANLALEKLGRRRGDYRYLSPNDHVNMAQSTNDTFPTAMNIAALLEVHLLDAALRKLISAFRGKGRRFRRVAKSARTHLQDAVPITLGQEFEAYADAIEAARQEIVRRSDLLKEVALGGTAVGTGLNAHPKYPQAAVGYLARITGVRLRPARNRISAIQSNHRIAAVSGSVRDLALELTRISNDLRLLSSGPTTGIFEINLPAVQPGSSIMPGKVNPVMAECLNMICFQVIGHDLTVSLAVQAGQFDLNVMMPLMAYNLLQSMRLLSSYLPDFIEKCITGITANEERCRRYFEGSVALATALNPHIGYLNAAEIAHQSLLTGESIKKLAIQRGIMTEEQFEAVTDPLHTNAPRSKGRTKDKKRRRRKWLKSQKQLRKS
ncbi:MAG: aspartate ammonia-lyase [Candidatus Abyssobacteria bacterium SURF_5]|uniref:Aspartate ammonia-lyase n=1 Tax=Abyssobacteria bacterium (strain SURF_5) TaxID=2093360 RepID=A0A3A4NT70_ABYX5|nr:MAG: aspartate ammonia-lyase [Candidatus Abyssubacteria bacterium SURF_5]